MTYEKFKRYYNKLILRQMQATKNVQTALLHAAIIDDKLNKLRKENEEHLIKYAENREHELK